MVDFYVAKRWVARTFTTICTKNAELWQFSSQSVSQSVVGNSTHELQRPFYASSTTWAWVKFHYCMMHFMINWLWITFWLHLSNLPCKLLFMLGGNIDRLMHTYDFWPPGPYIDFVVVVVLVVLVLVHYLNLYILSLYKSFKSFTTAFVKHFYFYLFIFIK